MCPSSWLVGWDRAPDYIEQLRRFPTMCFDLNRNKFKNSAKYKMFQVSQSTEILKFILSTLLVLCFVQVVQDKLKIQE